MKNSKEKIVTGINVTKEVAKVASTLGMTKIVIHAVDLVLPAKMGKIMKVCTFASSLGLTYMLNDKVDEAFDKAAGDLTKGVEAVDDIVEAVKEELDETKEDIEEEES